MQLRLIRYVRKYDGTGDMNTVECFKAEMKLHLPQVVLVSSSLLIRKSKTSSMRP